MKWLDTILGFKAYIIVATIAFGLGSLIAGGTTYKLTSNYLNAQHASVVSGMKLAQEQAVSEAKDTAAKLQAAQDVTHRELQAAKDKLLKERDAKINQLEKRAADYRPGNPAGRVLSDPGKTNRASCDRGANGTAQAAGAEKPDAGRLSDEASNFLLDFATSAEEVRQELIVQVEYGKATYEAYQKLRVAYDEIILSRTPSSRQ